MATKILRKITPEETPKPEPRGLRDRLAALIQSLPAAHQAGFKQFQEDYKMQLEIAEYAHADDVLISVAATEEVEQISANITALLKTFGEMGELAECSEEERFANILRPTQRWLASIITSDWPGNTQWIREHICEMGLGGEIRGGGREL